MQNERMRSEACRIDDIYSRRGYDTDQEYSDANPVYLHRVQSMERASLAGLAAASLVTDLSELSILDFGCGNARWFGRWIAWGATPENLTGVDLRERAVERARARFPSCSFQVSEGGGLPFADASFDIVVQNLVFTSILDDTFRREAALEIARVLKPNGVVLWCDFVYNNPRNANVKAVKKRELMVLFSGFELISAKRVVLAPPIARRLVPLSWVASQVLEGCIPLLCTHVLAVLRKSA